METVKAASLSNKVSSFQHLIPGTTTVRLDFPTVQILVHGLPTDRSLPDIAQELTTFNTGLALCTGGVQTRWSCLYATV